MIKSIAMLFLILSFIACGVNTDSSTRASANSGTDSGTATDSNSSDSNSTDDDTDSDINVNTSGDTFDRTDAVYDTDACRYDDVYQPLSDSSFDPAGQGDTDNGIEITSYYDRVIGDTSITDSAEVTIYYPNLTVEKENEDVNVNVREDYYFAFNKAWINNDNNTVYIKEPSQVGKQPSCYRFELTASDAEGLSSIKVYR